MEEEFQLMNHLNHTNTVGRVFWFILLWSTELMVTIIQLWKRGVRMILLNRITQSNFVLVCKRSKKDPRQKIPDENRVILTNTKKSDWLLKCYLFRSLSNIHFFFNKFHFTNYEVRTELSDECYWVLLRVAAVQLQSLKFKRAFFKNSVLLQQLNK